MRRLLLIAPLIAAACTDPYEVCPPGDQVCVRQVQDANLGLLAYGAGTMSDVYAQNAAQTAAYNASLGHTVYQGGYVTTYNGYGQPTWREYGY